MKLRLCFLCLSSALLGCGEPGLADGPDPGYEGDMFRAVLRRLTQPENLPKQGDWPNGEPDRHYYGPGFFHRYGLKSGNKGQLALAEQTRSFDERVVDKAMGDFEAFSGNLEENLMAAFGLIELQAPAATDASARQRVENFVDVLTQMSRVYEFYPETLGSTGWGITTYGPATVNGGLAMLNLEWALLLDGEARAKRVAVAQEILEAGRRKGFDESRGYYRFSSTRAELDLYPNVMQMVAHLRLHQLTGQPLPLQRARDLYRAIQPLKVPGETRYRSPYSAAAMGAKTDDYTTFSSQNYTTIAMALAYQVTKEAAFRDEALGILAFVRTHLLTDGRVVHHWMDGRAALPTDKAYYCAGCNLQVLYIIWRLQEWLAP